MGEMYPSGLLAALVICESVSRNCESVRLPNGVWMLEPALSAMMADD